MSDQQTAMQPRPTQYTVQNKTKGTEAAMLTVSDRTQIPTKTTHKDTERKENVSYYFIS